MNQREAKRKACHRAANVLETALGEGWLCDEEAIEVAVSDLIEELRRRAGERR